MRSVDPLADSISPPLPRNFIDYGVSAAVRVAGMVARFQLV